MIASIHLTVLMHYDMYHYVGIAMTLVASIYITELVSLIGIEHFNNCILVLFSYTISVSTNLSTSWKNTAVSMFLNISYYFIRLGIKFNEYKVDFLAICIVCCGFYLFNVIVHEMSLRQDKMLINKFSTLSTSICKLLDYLPYPILIQNRNEPNLDKQVSSIQFYIFF
jgi:hypothetical protein